MVKPNVSSSEEDGTHEHGENSSEDDPKESSIVAPPEPVKKTRKPRTVTTAKKELPFKQAVIQGTLTRAMQNTVGDILADLGFGVIEVKNQTHGDYNDYVYESSGGKITIFVNPLTGWHTKVVTDSPAMQRGLEEMLHGKNLGFDVREMVTMIAMRMPAVLGLLGPKKL